MIITNHLYPTSEQEVKVGSNKLTTVTLGNLTPGHTYRVSIYVNVDNPTGASCQLRSANGYSTPISTSQRVTYDFTANATSNGISVTSSGCDRVRILNGLCVEASQWDALTGYKLTGNYFNGDTMPKVI